MGRTLLDKIWEDHVVYMEEGCPAVLYIDLHLIHEATSPVAFKGLRSKGRKVRRPEHTIATVDHLIPTHDRKLPIRDAQAAAMISALEESCREFGIPLFGVGSEDQGIVHVISAELGLAQPGMTIVCGDSHTSSNGALGALAFGIGTSEVEHVLATQCLLQRKPGTFEIRVQGVRPAGTTAKDIILAVIAEIGIGGATGTVIEYTGAAIRSLSMEERLTICNMSIEAGARAGMIAPDETTFEYLHGRRFAPKGWEWDRAVERWRSLRTDAEARYDKTFVLDASTLEPRITFGTNPGMGIPISGTVPDPSKEPDPARRRELEKALAYMGLEGGKPLLGRPIDVVFIGSCTNSRLSDLREAASILRGRKVSSRVRVLVVPGSQHVKRQAEAEGLDRVFREAGCEWREPGCSMCIAMNGDEVPEGRYCVSTSNRNFEGRQGKGARTFLASPATAAACALRGFIEDPRRVSWIR